MNPLEFLTHGEAQWSVQYIAVTRMASYILEEEGYIPPRSQPSEQGYMFDHALESQRRFNERFTHHPDSYSRALLIGHASHMALTVLRRDGRAFDYIPVIPARFSELEPEVWEAVAHYYQPVLDSFVEKNAS